MINELINSIKENEGFIGHEYNDSLGKPTIGYGTLLPLSKEEGALLLEHRLKAKIKELEAKEPFFNKLPLNKQVIISEMCYQLGVNGVLKFRKMWLALKEFDYESAAIEMLDSRWAIQTPSRAKKLANLMKH